MQPTPTCALTCEDGSRDWTRTSSLTSTVLGSSQCHPNGPPTCTTAGTAMLNTCRQRQWVLGKTHGISMCYKHAPAPPRPGTTGHQMTARPPGNVLLRHGNALAVFEGPSAVRSRSDASFSPSRTHLGRPALEGDDECLAGRLLGDVDVTEAAHQRGDDPAVLLTEDPLDRPWAAASRVWTLRHGLGVVLWRLLLDGAHLNPPLQRLRAELGALECSVGARRDRGSRVCPEACGQRRACGLLVRILRKCCDLLHAPGADAETTSEDVGAEPVPVNPDDRGNLVGVGVERSGVGTGCDVDRA